MNSGQVTDKDGTTEGNITHSPIGPVEAEVLEVRQQGINEQIEYLLNRAMDAERTDQRDDDVENDHGIRLFSRQKNQSLPRILTTLLLLTLVYSVQIAALYNLNRGSYYVDTNVLIKWLERGLWAYPPIPVNPAEADKFPERIIGVLGGSEISVFDLPSHGFCLTAKGQFDVIFNVFIGLLMIYLFLFFDLWFVVFDMPLTRNFAKEPHGKIMLFGTVFLVLINSVVVTWLGVISGFAVIANSGDFYSVLFQSLQLFIILVIDDTVLPAVRFFVEEFGYLDARGNLTDDELKLVTHGSQYYKPGYGHSMIKQFRGKELCPKFIALLALFCLSTIVFAPAVVTIVYASSTFVRC